MDKHKKILIITNDFYPSKGGIQETIFGLAKQFNDRCVVFAPYYSGYNIPNDGIFNFSVVRTNGLRQDRLVDKLLFLVFRRPLTFLARTVFEIQRIIKKDRFSYILCGHITNMAIGLFVKWIMKIRLGVIVHGKEFLYTGIIAPFKRATARFLLSKSDIVFMSNSYVKEKLLGMGISEKRIVIIPFGVNFEKKPEVFNKDKKNGKKILLTVGRLVERKGHSNVIKALPIVIKTFPDIIYKIVGKGPMENMLRQLVKQMGLEKYVKFYGQVEDVVPFYRECDVFVMPSRFVEEKGDVEGFGLVYLEANFFGKPVIAGKSGGVSDAVIDGVTGLLVDPENPQEIANAITRLFKKPELAHKLGKQGRERVINEFTWERAARIIESKMSEISEEK